MVEPGGLLSMGSQQSRTRLKRLSSSSSEQFSYECHHHCEVDGFMNYQGSKGPSHTLVKN